MAAPGIGVGDIILACQTIYELGKRYKDAPKEFEEIADKAGSLEGTLERIRMECLENGNIVVRTGSVSELELANLLEPLRKDVMTLKGMVEKYEDIRRDGYGRRIMFAFWESGDLADLRRKIGLHEQALQMWYMTMIVSSLRRIEGGMDDALKKLETFRMMERMGTAKLERTMEKVLKNARKRNESSSYSRPEVMAHSIPVASAALGGASIRHRRRTRLSGTDTYTASSPPDEVTQTDIKPLKDELLKTGLPEAEVEATMADAVEYLFASRRKRKSLEEEAEIEADRVKRSASYETSGSSRHRSKSYGSYATRPGQSRFEDKKFESRPGPSRYYEDTLFETRPRVSRDRSEPRGSSPDMFEIRRSKSQREAPKVRIVTDEERAPPRNAGREKGRERPRANSDTDLEVHASAEPYLTIKRTPHFKGLEVPQSHIRRRASDASRNSDRERSRQNFLIVPEASHRRRSVPTRNSYEEVEFTSERILEVNDESRPRITRSQSPRPGVTHYVVRSDAG